MEMNTCLDVHLTERALRERELDKPLSPPQQPSPLPQQQQQQPITEHMP